MGKHTLFLFQEHVKVIIALLHFLITYMHTDCHVDKFVLLWNNLNI